MNILSNDVKKRSPKDSSGCFIKWYVYIMQVIAPQGDIAYKIGISENPEKRRGGLQSNCPWKVVLHRTFRLRNFRVAADIEAELHDLFPEQHIRGEWFMLEKGDVERIEDYFAKIYER